MDKLGRVDDPGVGFVGGRGVVWMWAGWRGRRVTTKGARGAKAEKPMLAIPVFFMLLELFAVIPLLLVWRVGYGLNSHRRHSMLRFGFAV